MKINKNFKIESDSLNVVLYKKISRKGEEYWSPISYYTTVKEALKSLVDQGVRDTDLTDLRTIVKAIDELKADIARLEIE